MKEMKKKDETKLEEGAIPPRKSKRASTEIKKLPIQPQISLRQLPLERQSSQQNS